MFGSEVFDVVIGILFVYLVLSLICSAIQEMIAAGLKMKARFLYQGICNLLADDRAGLVRDFYSHPLIASLFPGNYDPNNWSNLPSYIPARMFALAMMDIAAPPSPNTPGSGATGSTSPQPRGQGTGAGFGLIRLREALNEPGLPPNVKRALSILLDAAGGDASLTRENIEEWYNSAMQRVSGRYKRATQMMLLIVGLVVAAAVNADSIGIVRVLSTQKAVRESLAAASSQIAASKPGATADAPTRLQQFASCRADPTSPECRLDLNLNRIRTSGLPLGWVPDPAPGDLRGWPPVNPWAWVEKVIGILLTVAAVSFGAPFWFDLLSKFTKIRSA